MKTLIWFDGAEFKSGTTDDYTHALNDRPISLLSGYEYDSPEKAQLVAGSLNKSNIRKMAMSLVLVE
ncbi:MAG: hypothetical protein RJQ14_09525 [Marinoscillum sp.]